MLIAQSSTAVDLMVVTRTCRGVTCHTMNTSLDTAFQQRQSELADLAARFAQSEGMHSTAVGGLSCIRLSEPHRQLPAVYRPSLCVIVQGTKQVLLKDEVFRYSPAQFLVVSVDLPLVGQVVSASKRAPYLCLAIDIDVRQLAELLATTGQVVTPTNRAARGLFVGNLDASTQESVLRYARLLESPADISVLGPLMLREIHYRLLRSPYAAHLAQIAVAGSVTQRIGQVIRRIKTSPSDALRVEDLAALANMSPSSFHQQFKAVTAMSPLQYQKRLRLTEARQILLSGQADAASAAYRVGYQSVSQFSREYARMFGAPPIRDRDTLVAMSRLHSD